MRGSTPAVKWKDRAFPTRRGAAPQSLCTFEGGAAPLCLAGWDLIASQLHDLMPWWPHRPGGPGLRGETPHVTVAAAGGGFDVTTASPGGGSSHFPDAARAAHAAAGALITARLATEPQTIAAHAAAVIMAGRAFVLLGASQAGKSTIALHLALAGHRILGDDRLLLSAAKAPVAAVALGLAPKIRLPVPQILGPRFRRFVASRERARDHEQGAAYLDLKPAEQAAHGERIPVAALICLNRAGHGPTRLAPLPRPVAVRAIIDQGSAPHLNARAILAIAAGIADRVPAYELRYATSRRAAAALLARFRTKEGLP